MIGIFGLVIVVAISIYQFAAHGVGATGVPPGQRLHYFAAPLAASTLNGDPNLNPPCTPARHDPRALNVCLLARRVPLVLAFFVAGSKDCQRQIDVLQALSGEFPASAVQFAAVAVNAGHSGTAALMRSSWRDRAGPPDRRSLVDARRIDSARAGTDRRRCGRCRRCRRPPASTRRWRDDVSGELELGAAGFVEPGVGAEFPGLRLLWVLVEARLRDSPREVKQRLRTLSNQYRGANVPRSRRQPDPQRACRGRPSVPG
jgi:hypothetical protein